jgi:hypothetical protein
MISCLTWVPRGAADPRPKKYELSPAELNMLKIQAREEAGEGGEDDDEDIDDVEGSSDEEEGEEGVHTKATSSELPTVDISTLPDDLRMDEYSDDDEEQQAINVGQMIVGKDSEMVGTSLRR